MSKPNETDAFKRVSTKSIEQLDAEHANDAPGGSLPVTWKDGHTGKTMRGKPLQLATPSEGEVEVFGNARASTCGHCKFYDLEGGRKQIVKERFAERLVREEQWKMHHVGDVESLGICKQRPSMVVSYITKSCELFQLRKKR